MNGPPARVVVTVGTDHHRFDRLMGWVDGILDAGLVGADEVLVQHGASQPPGAVGETHRSLPRAELLDRMGRAAVVVGHGGPGTIMDARSVGRLPVVVPRVPGLGEVVDDHQVVFSRELARRGIVVLAEEQPDFLRAVARGLADPEWLRLPREARPDVAASAVAKRFEDIVSGLTLGSRPKVARRVHDLWVARMR